MVKKEGVDRVEGWMEVGGQLRDPERLTSIAPFVYTPGEFTERLGKGDPFLKDIVRSGIVLYG